jgi:hypothetical protein
MTEARSHTEFIGWRSELLAELFLRELEPEFLSRPTQDLGFDFLMGFANRSGGINTFAVEVKGTDREISNSFPLDKRSYRRLASSSPRGILLAVDVKNNRLFYGWPERDGEKPGGTAGRIRVPVTEINEKTKPAFRKQLIN